MADLSGTGTESHSIDDLLDEIGRLRSLLAQTATPDNVREALRGSTI
jgi:hypothetical protein